jgi:Flp pilus assembly pilin Flp
MVVARRKVVRRQLLRLASDCSGATAVEYGIIVSAIAGVIAVVVYVLGAKTNNLYNNVQNRMP